MTEPHAGEAVGAPFSMPAMLRARALAMQDVQRKLGDLAACPSAGLWILEIQIAHATRAFGAFHEDLLVDEPQA